MTIEMDEYAITGCVPMMSDLKQHDYDNLKDVDKRRCTWDDERRTWVVEYAVPIVERQKVHHHMPIDSCAVLIGPLRGTFILESFFLFLPLVFSFCFKKKKDKIVFFFF